MNRALVAVLLCGSALCAGDDSLGVFDDSTDVGQTPMKGRVEYDAARGEYKITGGGANMWLRQDAFRFLWKKVSGDVAITADVRFVGTGVNPHRKAALIIRQTAEPGSAYADAALHGDGLTSLQYRPTPDALTLEVRSDLKAPTRLRIERRGNEFLMLAGPPGGELKPTGPVTVALQDPVYAGLAVCSHDESVLETAIFSNVKVEALGARPKKGE